MKRITRVPIVIDGVEYESSGWEYTDANRFVSCPKCDMGPGDRCRTPKGRKAEIPHFERLIRLRKISPITNYQMPVESVLTISEILGSKNA